MDGKLATNKYILFVNRLFKTTGGTLKRVFQCAIRGDDASQFLRRSRRKMSLTNAFYRETKYLVRLAKICLKPF